MTLTPADPLPDLEGGTPDQWDSFYAETTAVDASGKLRSAADRTMLQAVIALTRIKPGMRIAELGCGDPTFLPRIAVACGARVAGVDFSSLAIARAHAALAALGVDSSEIEQGEISAYVERHEGEFDAVISFGLVEHFADLDEIVATHFRCTRPGGRVFISAPNLSGHNLAWARATSPQTFSLERSVTTVWHRPISSSEVVAAFQRCEAQEIEVDFVGGPRLWAYPQSVPGRSKLRVGSARALRKSFNGAGEALNRISQSLAKRLSGSSLSPSFAVAGSKPVDRVPTLDAHSARQGPAHE